MGMNIYNRAHPYVKHMEEEYIKVQRQLVENTSILIKYFIILIILNMASTILTYSMIPLFTNMIIIAILVYLYIGLIRDDSLNQANQYINGPDYQVVNINEQNIINAIQSLYLLEGKLIQFKNNLDLTSKVLFTIHGIVILYQLVQLCIPYLTR